MDAAEAWTKYRLIASAWLASFFEKPLVEPSCVIRRVLMLNAYLTAGPFT
jgi:hypothetical protein